MLAFQHYLPKCELKVHLTEVEYPPEVLVGRDEIKMKLKRIFSLK